MDKYPSLNLTPRFLDNNSAEEKMNPAVFARKHPSHRKNGFEPDADFVIEPRFKTEAAYDEVEEPHHFESEVNG